MKVVAVCAKVMRLISAASSCATYLPQFYDSSTEGSQGKAEQCNHFVKPLQKYRLFSQGLAV